MRLSWSGLLTIAVPFAVMVAGSEARADLIGTQVTFGTLFRETSTSAPVVVSTTVSETVSASTVTFPAWPHTGSLTGPDCT